MDLDLDRERAALWVAGAALFAALAFVVYSYVGTVVLGVFIYYVARPVYDRLRGYVPTRSLAALVALLVFILPVLVLFVWTLGLALGELVAFSQSRQFAEYVEMLAPYVDLVDVEATVRALIDGVRRGTISLADLRVGQTFSGVLDAVLGSLGTAGSVGLHLFVAGIIGFYLLRDDYRLVAWARRTVVPEGSVFGDYVAAVDRDLRTIYFGNILNAFLTGTIAAITYTLLDGVAPQGLSIPVPPLLGVLTGAASLVPVVGIKLTYLPVLAYLLAQALLGNPEGLWFPVVFGLVSVVVVDVIPDLVLRPYVSGRTVHVGTLMVAYVFGPLLFGWYGIFLGPLLLVVVLEFGRLVVPWLLSPEAPSGPPVEPAFAPPVEPPTVPDAPVEPGDSGRPGVEPGGPDGADVGPDSGEGSGARRDDGPEADPGPED